LNHKNSQLSFKDGHPIFDALMPELLSSVIPEALSVLILLLILSASMSTLAALVLISSSSFAKDLYAGFINKNVSDKGLTTLMRLSSLFFVFLSVVLAYLKPATIVAILGISWGAIGSVFLGPFIWGLFWKKANRTGAIASSFLGLASCLILYYFFDMPSPQSGTIGMIVSVSVTPLAGILNNK
ncbi:MAG: sodium:solute symporter, partial [Candidatus Zixiibacteriota bacterium]